MSLLLLISTVATDTGPPTVAITAPDPASVLTGTVAVTADAADDVAVTGVQFKLNGFDLQAEDMTGPYSVSWDTTQSPNGVHMLTAVARDAVGNRTTAGPVYVLVANPVVYRSTTLTRLRTQLHDGEVTFTFPHTPVSEAEEQLLAELARSYPITAG
jgi:hypothetical protein